MARLCEKEVRFARLNPKRVRVVDELPLTDKVRVETASLENGRTVRKGEWKDVPLEDRYKGLNWFDFSIDSLQASGMLAEMTYSTLSDSSINIADSFDSVTNNNLNAE